MCGIIITSSTTVVNPDVEKYVAKRGPDNKNEINWNGLKFIHYLLHLSGKKVYQPYIQDDVLIIFNGEIYNYRELEPDTNNESEVLFKQYVKKGNKFVKDLDGEFVIVLFDKRRDLIMISTDVFGTKPFFYHIDGSVIHMSSYKGCCSKLCLKGGCKSVLPNRQLIFNWSSGKLLTQCDIHSFDLTQKKDTYDDYIGAFERAVLKRYPEKFIPIVSLSSGLDSGAIACCLNKYKKDVLYISFNRNEDNAVIQRRKQILKTVEIMQLSKEDKEKYNKCLKQQCEPFCWDFRYNKVVKTVSDGFIQGSMLAKSKLLDVCSKKSKQFRVLYSGIGADEVMARNQYYSCGYGNVDVFPNDLSKVFPWKNFYEGSMKEYLKGDEYVGGSYGYETRYPFCDREVVQEFLWLKPELKNSYKGSIYKPALQYYMDINKFPYARKKYGFNV